MNKKKIIIVSLAIAFIVIISIVTINLFNKDKNKDSGNNIPNEIDNSYQIFESNKDNLSIRGLDNTDVIDKDTAKNKSEKLKEVKVVGNLEISNIEVIYDSFETRITGKIHNKENKDLDSGFIFMNILDENRIVETNKIYVGQIKANGIKDLDFVTTANIVNLYDIAFTK